MPISEPDGAFYAEVLEVFDDQSAHDALTDMDVAGDFKADVMG